MSVKVRQWFQPQLVEAADSERTWRLRCIQAEAELRALLSEESVPESGSSKIDEGNSALSSNIFASLIGAATEVGPRTNCEIELVLAQVLGIEKFMAEFERWKARMFEDTAAAEKEVELLQAQIKEQNLILDQETKEVKYASEELETQLLPRQAEREEHVQRCRMLEGEVEQILLTSGLQKPSDGFLGISYADAELDRLDTSIEDLQDCVHEAARQRELCCMCREDMSGKSRAFVDIRRRSTREIAQSRQIVQSHQVSQTRLSGELSRSRTRAEKQRKQLDVQLTACRRDLADAVKRAETAADQLRKVKQQQGRQLQKVRSETNGLQSEVDAHLRFMEETEKEINRLLHEESALQVSEDSHVAKEHFLEQQATSFVSEQRRFEEQSAEYEADYAALLANFRPLEDARLEEELAASEARIEEEFLVELTTKSHVAAQRFEEWLAYASAECKVQEAELQRFHFAQDEFQKVLSQRNATLLESKKMEETSKQLRQGTTRQLSEFREIQRRTQQLKASHNDLMKILPSNRSKEVNAAPFEQALGRASKRADTIIALFDHTSTKSVPSKAKNGTDSKTLATSNISSSQAEFIISEQLQQKLAFVIDQELRSELLQCKQSLADEQDRFIQKTKTKTDELQGLRRERRTMEDQLGKVKKDAELASTLAEQQLKDLDQIRDWSQMQIANGVYTVTAEYLDLSQKQALERDALRIEIEHLKMQLGEEVGSFENDEKVSTEQLQDVAADIQTLRAEEEELLAAFIQLKAALASCEGRPLTLKGALGESPSSSKVTSSPSMKVSLAKTKATTPQPQLSIGQSMPEEKDSDISSPPNLLVTGDLPASPTNRAKAETENVKDLPHMVSTSSLPYGTSVSVTSGSMSVPPAQGGSLSLPSVAGNSRSVSPNTQSHHFLQSLQQIQEQHQHQQQINQLRQFQQQLQKQQVTTTSYTQQQHHWQAQQLGSVVMNRTAPPDAMSRTASGNLLSIPVQASSAKSSQLLRGSLASSLPSLALSALTVSPQLASPRLTTHTLSPPSASTSISIRHHSANHESTVYTWPSQFRSNSFTVKEGFDIRNMRSFG